MKVRLEYSVSVDPPAWIEHHGLTSDEAERWRDHVKSYFEDLAHEFVEREGLSSEANYDLRQKGES